MLNVLLKQVLASKSEFLGLEETIEKEILHHDIMTVLHNRGLLQQLTFIGGTSLRLCYNSSRLSEDLDFTAGIDFKADQFNGLAEELKSHLENKYGLKVKIREPKLSKSDTSTWKITIEKYANRPDLPSQKMHIDVCSLPSFDIKHRPILDHYSINSPMSGLPIPVQSMDEIMADKMVAFAFRERRIKPRDVWDIIWLKQQSIEQRPDLVMKKLKVREKSTKEFLANINKNSEIIQNSAEIKKDFYNEMGRFLPGDVRERTLNQDHFWKYLSETIEEEVKFLTDFFTSKKKIPFKL